MLELQMRQKSTKERKSMEVKNERTTAPMLSAPTDNEQSPQTTNQSNEIITDDAGNVNNEFSEFEKYRAEQRKIFLPSYMPTISMSELYETVYPAVPPIVEGLLYAGTYLFAGSPKYGKSFLVAQIAYHISSGTPLWDYPTNEGTVLYLALVVDYKRLQTRLYRMFGMNCTKNLHLSISAKQLSNGLDEQLKGFIAEHKDAKLIIIDTLQKIRELGGDGYSYASDYDIITRLKNFASSYGICLLLVHHTRKQQADYKFDMISGTTGLLGAADGAFLLQKEKRTSNNATLDVSGRDQQDQRLHLVRDEETLI